jgi:hypothetical protein
VSTIQRARSEVATIIEQFLEGTGGKWDWDNFCSNLIADPELDHIRALCESADLTYPPTEKGHCCSAEGRAFLRSLVEKLRK